MSYLSLIYGINIALNNNYMTNQEFKDFLQHIVTNVSLSKDIDSLLVILKEAVKEVESL